jgi:hypothetical protein
MNHTNSSFAKSAIFTAAFAAALFFASAPNLSARAGSSAANQPQNDGQSSSTSSSKPNLAGQWTLNKDQSDDPRQKMQQAMGNDGNGGDNGGGGGGHHGGMRGGGQGHGGGMMMNDFSQLTIAQTETSVKVTGASGRVVAAYPAEQPTSKPSSNSNNGEGEHGERQYTPPVAKWQGSQLVTSNEGPRGGSMNRTYELSSDGKQLIVTSKMQTPRMDQPISIRFVYDPAKPASGSGTSQ